MRFPSYVPTLVLTLLLSAGALAHEPPSDWKRPAPQPDVETQSASADDGVAAPADRADGDAPPAVERRVAAVSGTPVYSRQATSNTRHEIESAITAVTIGSSDHTAGAYMREVNDVFRIHTISSTTPASTSLYHWTRNTPSLPSGHGESVDPVLDVNPYTTGIAPTRIYLGGLTYAVNAQGSRIAPQAITVWRSDNGGQSWSSPAVVDSNASSSPLLDKPDVAVSWYSSSRGYLYVAYMKVKTSGMTFVNELWVARSTNGGLTFPSKVKIAQGHIQAPQVVVSSNTGKVYVIWLDLDNHQLKMASSLHTNFTTWTSLPSLSTPGRFLLPCEFGVCDPIAAPGASNCTGGLLAVTVPHARYNWVKDQIGVVWHARETTSPGATTDVFFSAYGVSGWSTPKRVHSNQIRDQWYPALDFDSTGDYLVVYYDRSQDSSNLLYREAWAHIDSNGNRLGNGFVSGVFDSDPSEVYSPGSYCFKGEYQDVWFWPYSDANGPRFHSLWTGHPPSATNVDDEVWISAIK